MEREGSTTPDTFRDRLMASRRLWQERLRAFPLAFSTDGRSFSWNAPLTHEVTVGGYLRLAVPGGSTYLGQVLAKDVASLTGPEIEVAGDSAGMSDEATGDISRMAFTLALRRLEGTGALLGRFDGGSLVPTSGSDRFEDAVLEPATSEDVSLYLQGQFRSRATLDIGAVASGDGKAPARLDATGFSRHSFLCGQSGSGKTYSLGVILERILAETDLRMVIIDPNSDFVRLGELRSSSETGDAGLAKLRTRYRAAAGGVRVMRPATVAPDEASSLRVRFSDLDPVEQGLVLGLDPIRDREEFAALRSLVEQFGSMPYDLGSILDAAQRQFPVEMRSLALRIANLGVANWPVWAPAGASSLADVARDWRALVLDVGGFESAMEKAVVSMAVLGRLWRQRENRQPVLVVMDEAHNIAPASAGDALQEAAVGHAVRIAAEGRKYGLYLFMATQRPDKMERNVVSQCDNIVMMRMNSADDVNQLGSLFSFVPLSLLSQATSFRQGEALVAGKISPAPLLVRFGRRLTEEGGGDVPLTWARR